MLNISNRGQQMPASTNSETGALCRNSKKKKGIKVYHLNIGQPDIETPPPILDAVRKADIKVLEYSHSAGNGLSRKLSTVL
jgi:aspartate aminotransferase